jgi:hypothetical protein
MEEMSDMEREVREVPRRRCELWVAQAACRRRRRTSVWMALGMAVCVGRLAMYAARAAVGLEGAVGDMRRST